MTDGQKVIKGLAIVIAIFFIVCILVAISSIIFYFSDDFKHSKVNPLQTKSKTYTLNENIKDIDINLKTAEVDIISGDKFELSSNIYKLSFTDNFGKLEIKDNRTAFDKRKEGKVTLTMPKDTDVNSIMLKLKAGKIKYNFPKTSKLDISTEFGDIELKNGYANYLSIKNKVGEIELEKFNGDKIDIDTIFGDIELKILKNKYEITTNVGLGNVYYNGKEEVRDFKTREGNSNLYVKATVGELVINNYED